jgi:hypothetical protein
LFNSLKERFNATRLNKATIVILVFFFVSVVRVGGFICVVALLSGG